jgi:transcriptional regulator with GAF, ATPase, and Fis domain
LTIGRDAQNGVCVPEQAVSRQHAQVEWNGARWTLTDLSSRNGTIVDGRYVTRIELEHLCEIRVGDAIFKFVESGAERYLPYRIDGSMIATHRLSRALHLDLIGNAQMDRIAADLERISTTELSCVILGETGTGKEVAARGLHRASGRTGSFQAINCAAIPQNLLESELFGYRRGAFSGADRDKPGLIKLADRGTLFLDEIGDMPLEAQAKMLRVLQAREVFPLGATTPEPVNIRVVCATHRDLVQYVREGRFRGDLFARLNEHMVRLPPLAERKEDIFMLSVHFARKYAAAAQVHGQVREPALTFPFLMALLHYDWPFNVRELESCIKRAVALSGGGPLERVHLPDAIREHMKTYAEKPPAPSGRPSLYPAAIPAPAPAPPYAAGSSHAPPHPYPFAAAVPATSHGTPDRTIEPIAERAPTTPFAGASRPPGPGAANTPGTPDEAHLRALLEKHQGNVAAVGREFGKERMQVHRWLRRYNIDLAENRKGG